MKRPFIWAKQKKKITSDDDKVYETRIGWLTGSPNPSIIGMFAFVGWTADQAPPLI